jgi:SagB-type dehydrogenase family enzyme
MLWWGNRCLCGVVLALVSSLAAAATAPPIQLPAPQTSGGKPLMQALKQRHTSRDFRSDALPRQTLSNLLWAAFGVNRPASGGRTAPSAHDAQDIDVYVVLSTATYLYRAKENALAPVRAGDLRALTGRQDFVRDAPVSLVYVADFARFPRDSEQDKAFYSAADAGHISQNVYLFAASEGLAAMVRAYIDKPALSRALGLRPAQHVVLAQSVGYPR